MDILYTYMYIYIHAVIVFFFKAMNLKGEHYEVYRKFWREKKEGRSVVIKL